MGTATEQRSEVISLLKQMTDWQESNNKLLTRQNSILVGIANDFLPDELPVDLGVALASHPPIDYDMLDEADKAEVLLTKDEMDETIALQRLEINLLIDQRDAAKTDQAYLRESNLQLSQTVDRLERRLKVAQRQRKHFPCGIERCQRQQQELPCRS